MSVVTDSHVSYFVSDDDEAQQIAQLVNTAQLSVPDVIKLGVNLIDALHLNGSQRSKREQHALPAARVALDERIADDERTPTKHLAPSDLKSREPVRCQLCGRTMRRKGYPPHLINVHKWSKQRAHLEARTTTRIDDSEYDPQPGTRVPSEPRRTTSGRAIPARRIPVADTWPNLTADSLHAFIKAHPDGVSIRECAIALADDSHRGRQTIGNLLQTLNGRGVITKSDGVRPHFKSGKPTATMIVRAK